MGNKHSTSLPPQVADELEETTSFTYSEINDLYRQFLHDCPDLHMTASQFKQLYRDTFPNGNSDNFAQHIFQTFDTENCGHITFQQFVTTLNAQLKGTFENKLKWLFGLYDSGKSGYITKGDLTSMITALHDLNADTPSAKESHVIDEIVENIMRHADQNQDGKISLQDFVNTSLSNDTLANLLKSTIKAADSPYLRRKQRRGSIGIPLHSRHPQQQSVPSDSDAQQEDAGAYQAQAQAAGRRASLTPNMLDFNSMMKHQP